MIKQLSLLLILLLSFTLNAQKESKEIKQFVSELDQKIPQILNDFIVPGTAIAIIENGEIILQKGYGYSNIDKGIKVTKTTGFNIGSISKTIAAWGVLKLVQEGKIDLDAPAEKYLTRWHLPKSAFDPDKVTIRRLLSHTAGLSLHGYPGWSPKDRLPTIEESLNGKNNGPGRVEIIMEPGTKYKYSGGGFSILQLIIEEVTKQKFEDYMQKEILNPLGMTNSSYTINDDILKSSSQEHNNFGDVIDFELFTAQAAAGFHTTIKDFTKFAQASLYASKNNKKYQQILTAATLEQMMEPAPASNGNYGLGYQVDSIQGTSMTLRGHGGANTGWHAFLRVNPVTNDGFIVITNGGAGHNIYRQLFCDWIYWKTGEALANRCNILPSIANKLKQIVDDEGIDTIEVAYAKAKKNQANKYNFSENQLNQLGYHYLGKDKIENAIAIFKINVDAFPDSFNVYDSYGEALLKRGDKEKAVENYLKSVELNPGSEDGIKALNDLGVNIPIEWCTAKIGIIGSAISADTKTQWTTDVDMATTDGINYTLTTTLLDGDAKFRQNNTWTINWGDGAFPSGTGVANSNANIPIVAGTYDIIFNKSNGAYTFSVSGLIKEIIIDDAILEAYVGKYQLAPEFVITVSKDGSQMKAQATGQAEFEIYPKSENVFYLKVVEAQITFNSNEDGQVVSMTLLQGGQETTGLRL